jgi:hypothetical protein
MSPDKLNIYYKLCPITLDADSADKQLISNRFKPEPEKGPQKVAPENRTLTRSCGETKAAAVVPATWVAPDTESAPEEVRIAEVPRTAANTTVIIGR